MNVLISGGGSGGHIYPALAFIKRLEVMDNNLNVLYVGSKNRMEKDIIPTYGYEYKALNVIGLQGNVFNKIRFLCLIVIATLSMYRFYKKNKYDLVIGTGGYVSAPAVYAAYLRKIPTIIYDADFAPGKVTKLLAPKVNAVLGAYDQLNEVLNVLHFEKIGNPTSVCLNESTKMQDVLIVFGSLGSETMNQKVIDYLNNCDKSFNYTFITGKAHFDDVKKHLNNRNVKLLPYSNNITDLIAEHDLVISRGGSTLLSEIICSLRPSLIVPSPYVTNNEQLKNVEYFASIGACDYVVEKNIDASFISEWLNSFDDKKYQKYVSSLKSCRTCDSLDKFEKKVRELVNG